jgi:hypothetical protein
MTTAIETYTVLLLPTNNTGVFGARASPSRRRRAITVDLDLAGLEANLKHATHIHGFTDDRASIIPNLQVDATATASWRARRPRRTSAGPVLHHRGWQHL